MTTTSAEARDPAPSLHAGAWAGKRWDFALLALVTVIVVLVQLRYLKPPWLYDPTDYFHSAAQWPEVFVHHRPLRVGLVLPIRIAQSLFGFSELAWYAVPVASYALLAAATFTIGRMLYGRAVGFVAALIAVVNPYVLTWSSQVFPDVPSAALFASAVALVIYVGRTNGRGTALTVRSQFLLAGAGGLLGWSYLVREFIVVLFPIVAIVLMVYRVNWKAVVTVGVSALAVLGLELVWNQIQYGDALVRFREVVDKEPATTQREIERVRATLPDERLSSRLTVLPRLLLEHSVGLLFLVLLAVGAAGLWIDRKKALPLMAWVFLVWLILFSVDFVRIEGKGLLRPTLIRYWYPLFPPLVVAGVGSLTTLVRRWNAMAATAAAVAILVIAGQSSISAMENQRGTYLSGATEYREFREHLQETQPKPTTVWTDGRLARVLPVFLNDFIGNRVWGGTVGWLNNARRFEERRVVAPGDLVLIDDEFFRPRHSNYRGAVPGWLLAFPLDWDVRWVSRNSGIVLFDTVAGDDEVVVQIGDDVRLDWEFAAGMQEVPGDTRSLEEPAVTVSEGDRGLVLSPQEYGHEATPVHVEEGSYIRFRVQVGADGAGNVVPRCLFLSDTGTVRVNAVSTWGVPAEVGDVDGVCRAPAPGSWRLALELSGPVRVALGSLTVWVDDDGSDGG